MNTSKDKSAFTVWLEDTSSSGFKSYNDKLFEAKSSQQQLARENCEALANIAKEKQEEISKLLEAHQQDKENICREFTEKQEVIEQEYIKVTDDLQKQVEIMQQPLNLPLKHKKKVMTN